jgi:hypothetical protein
MQLVIKQRRGLVFAEQATWGILSFEADHIFMFYGILADVIAFVHFGYVSFVVVGQALILAGIVLRWRWIRNMKFRVIHLAMILIVALESLGGLMCPLTDWESDLRELAGQPRSGDSFVADLVRIMWFNSVPYNHWIFKSAYVSFAALVLMTFIVAPPRRRVQATENLDVDRGVFATALLGTLAFILLYTAVCMDAYKRERFEDISPVYFTALTGVYFLGQAIVCWAVRPRTR